MTSTAASFGGREVEESSAVDLVSSQDSVQMRLLPSERPAPTVSINVINQHHQFSEIAGAYHQGQSQLSHFNLSSVSEYQTVQHQQNLQAQKFSQVTSVQQAPTVPGSLVMAQMQRPHAPYQPPSSETLMQRFMPTQVASGSTFSPAAASIGRQQQQALLPGPNYSASQINSAAPTQPFSHAWMANSMHMQQTEGIQGLAGTTPLFQSFSQYLDLNPDQQSALPSQHLYKMKDNMQGKTS